MNVIEIGYSLIFFVIAIGVLVTFHEFGHYWVARKLNVKVLRFSIGFGKPLWSRTWRHGNDEIEYVIAAIPLGGYVKMLDEREAPVDSEDLHRAFNTQSIPKRVAIVIAGPLFNFILAIALYWVVFLNGETGARPVIVPVEHSLAAQAGFTVEDEIISITGEPVNSWQNFRLQLIDQGMSGGTLEITVKTASNELLTRKLVIGDRHLLAKQDDVTEQLGFSLWQPVLPAIIGTLEDKSAGQRGGLLVQDKILAINDEPIASWSDTVNYFQARPGQALTFKIIRSGVERSFVVTPDTRKKADIAVGYLGASPYISDELRTRLSTHTDYNVFEAAVKAVAETWNMSFLTLRVLGKMLLGEASLKNISGPITIATYAGISASISLLTYIGFLAVISVSLGVLNLLPIPMLDGGHLFYFLIEAIKGSPVSEKVEVMAQQVGIAVLLMLMMLAMYNDIQRLIN